MINVEAHHAAHCRMASTIIILRTLPSTKRAGISAKRRIGGLSITVVNTYACSRSQLITSRRLIASQLITSRRLIVSQLIASRQRIVGQLITSRQRIASQLRTSRQLLVSQLITSRQPIISQIITCLLYTSPSPRD